MIVDPDFLDHWKTRMLVNSLNDEAAPLYVLRLWAHCQNRRQSTFELSTEALKALCRYPGAANKLESSLTASGFVRRAEGMLEVCNWDDYNASLIASWVNGKRGGRPRKETSPAPKTHGLPSDNPDQTQAKPTHENPTQVGVQSGLNGGGQALMGVDEDGRLCKENSPNPEEENPRETHGLPGGNPPKTRTKPIREEEIREEYLEREREGGNEEDENEKPPPTCEPVSARSAKFREAWNRLRKHMMENGKPLTGPSEQMNLYNLVRAYPNEDEQIQVIDFTIANNWKTLVLNGDHKGGRSVPKGPSKTGRSARREQLFSRLNAK